MGGEARGRALEAGESLRGAVPSEHRAVREVREVRAGAGDAVSMGGVAGLALDDGAAMGAGEGAMDAGTDAPSGAALHFSFGAWKDIFGGIGGEELLLLGVLLLVSGEEGGTVLPLCLLLLLLCG